LIVPAVVTRFTYRRRVALEICDAATFGGRVDRSNWSSPVVALVTLTFERVP
jgi:hypothetical protein